MPEISRFYGIRIYMLNNEHEPPHIHVDYSGKREAINIRTGEVLNGSIPKRAHKMVIEWWDEHRKELLEMWELNDRNRRIPPLD